MCNLQHTKKRFVREQRGRRWSSHVAGCTPSPGERREKCESRKTWEGSISASELRSEDRFSPRDCYFVEDEPATRTVCLEDPNFSVHPGAKSLPVQCEAAL